MRTSHSTWLVLTFLFIILAYTACRCVPNCKCRDSGNYSSVCHFDSPMEANITADALFDTSVENIQSLRLEFNANQDFDSIKFPFKSFFQLGFSLLTDLCIVSDMKLRVENPPVFRMDELEALPRLSKFSFHVKNMEIVPANMSSRLKLRHLDVSSSRNINFDQLCKIVKFSGPGLEEVYADGINDDNPNLLAELLDDQFFSCFQNTTLRTLSIPESNIRILSSPNLDMYIPSLESLDISRNDVFIENKTYFAIFKLKKMKKLIASSVPFPKIKMEETCEYDKWIKNRSTHLFCEHFHDGLAIMQNLEVLNIGGSTDCHGSNTFYCARQSQCIFPNNTGLRELYLDHVCIKRLDMLISGLNRLEKLDFSSNLCEYISSHAFANMASLTSLLLNGNSLSKMVESDPEEFGILFQQNHDLQILNLSANGLSRIPSEIFKTNTKLEVLDLSKNFLHTTDWLIRAMVYLRSLNLTENRISEIDTPTRQVMKDLANRNNYSIIQVDGILVRLAGNPISCNCNQEDMLNWLANNRQYITDIDGIVCSENGGFISAITNDMDRYRNSCEFQRYKGLLALCSIPFIATICVVLYIRHYRHILRIRRIRKQLDEFVQDNFHVQQRFLLYLAYSFSDSDEVLTTIYPELERRLQKELGVNENLVCISDRDFGVGVSITDEIINAVSSSCAALFIVSKEFARSRWCEFEAEIALYQGKPIILVTLGDVKIRSLPTSLRKVCFKWTRLEWPGANNPDKLEGFWKRLVNAIVKYTDDDTLLNRNLV
ncbi:hypothetical protein ACJMK2_001025 [Sinanodonta woodiana]|uniref:TIR domain-containing protein n=1 Tax=Sinanodonta woodiana TaxID=1069815 RepID=A0ABD3XSR6_SINWO